MSKPKSPAAILGSLGGKARAKKLTDKQRSEIARKAGLAAARKAAEARWAREKEKKG